MTAVPDNTATAGRHIVLELYGCDEHRLDDIEWVEQALRNSAQLLLAPVIKCLLHQFTPQGVTGVLLLEGTHLAIHTWPENGYAAIDLYAQAGSDLEAASGNLFKAFRAQDKQSVTIDRGLLHECLSSVKDHETIESTILDLTAENIPPGIRVDKSHGRGLGLFATQPFEKGEILYEAPGHLVNWQTEIVVKTDAGTSVHPVDNYGYEILPAFAETWPKATLDFLKEYYDSKDADELVFAMTDEGEYETLITGVNGLQNHSDSPNTLLDFDAASVVIGNDDLPHWTIPVRALCDINEGDELFADYRHALPDFVPNKSWLP